MCGIYGYVGSSDAYKKVYDGLKLLQYRGYDSCGIAYYNKKFILDKAVGTLEKLIKPKFTANIAFGHTRWATNGKVNLENTHPHISYDENYVIVHNGIITNADILKEDMQKLDIPFYSQTDTEIIANLIASKKGEEEKNIVDLFNILQGSFSLIIGNKKGDLYLVKRFSPLNILCADDGIYISSDISSLPNGELYSLNDGDILKIENGKIKSLCGNTPNFCRLENKQEDLSLGDHPHYMQKEIFETPKAIYNTYNYIKNIDVTKIFKHITEITLLGCGTAYHSCLIGEYLLNSLNKFNIKTMLASAVEIDKKLSNKHLFIIVSQSGETADCIKAAQKIKANGGKILIITNQEKSSICKFADNIIYTKANKELAVASTKTYSCQVFVFAYLYNKLIDKKYQLDIVKFSNKLNEFLKNVSVEKIVDTMKEIDKTILIAKDVDYLTMLEASLKIREINYIYTIPMLSSELKHGTLSLIENGTKVLALNSSEDKYKLDLAIHEIESRGGEVVKIEKYNNFNNIENCYKPIFTIIPFQLLTYKLALAKGLNPDMPRNLAKSVTVE